MPVVKLKVWNMPKVWNIVRYECEAVGDRSCDDQKVAGFDLDAPGYQVRQYDGRRLAGCCVQSQAEMRREQLAYAL